MKFLDRLIEQMENYVRLEKDESLGYDVPHYREYLKRLRDPECKRFIFDARQAALFDDLDESPPPNIQRRIHPPFPMFYMEFTEPILLASQEPGYQDYARALLYVGHERLGSKIRMGGEQYPTENAVMFLTTDQMDDRAKRLYGLPARLPSSLQQTAVQYVDRAWSLRLEEGMALARVQDAKENGSELPEDWEEGYFLATESIPGFKDDRLIGWWEETIRSYTDLLSWICAYTMAKGIHIVMEPVSRQVRRWHERKNIPLPQPWHIVKVEPKWGHGATTGQNEGGQHRYRYDVIGHLRFGRHPRKDGSFHDTIEWVPPHQRGLANEIYIPKLYKVERGKVISPLMRKYYGES